MVINFVTPPMGRRKFSGGMYCIMKYADGLARRGHKVNVIPQLRSKKPEWIDCAANIILARSVQPGSKSIKEYLNTNLDQKLFRKKNKLVKQGINLNYMQYAIPEADLTIATAWTTAETVHRFGTGRKVYFMQGFEPLFFQDLDSYDKYLCAWSYFLPLHKIANSSWLEQTVTSYLQAHGITEKIYKCLNAVDLDIYGNINHEKVERPPGQVRVISYGGKKMPIKGFDEMAQAISLARNNLKDLEIEWYVFGEANLPPHNKLAPYKSLGFLQPRELAKAYLSSEILLSASWYESFPLFPIEAMASGLATITTKKGTEDYAIHGQTAHIVEEKNIQSIAGGLIKLISDDRYRTHLAAAGKKIAKEFNWERSLSTMEGILIEIMNGENYSRSESWYGFSSV